MVKIIGDTTSALPEAVAKQYAIPIIPQIINIDNHSYLEGIEIDYRTFLAKLETAKALPKTAAPPPELFVKEFEKALLTKSPVLCILPSAVVSGTVRSAEIALKTMSERQTGPVDVRIIDTRLIASPVAVLLELTAKWAQEGLAIDALEQRVREMSQRGKIYFLVDTLKYLAMGGRIGAAAALVGSVLQVKPVLTFEDGQIAPYEKIRTHKRGVTRLKELVCEQIAPQENGYLSVMQAAAEEEAYALAEELKQELGISHVPIYTMPPAVVTHGGPGILGVGFFTI
ncbi:MAG: DegV family protein [Anaerolineae bacterium]|nr:DegV family protein [Anaerolineae bacterium]